MIQNGKWQNAGLGVKLKKTAEKDGTLALSPDGRMNRGANTCALEFSGDSLTRRGPRYKNIRIAIVDFSAMYKDSAGE